MRRPRSDLHTAAHLLKAGLPWSSWDRHDTPDGRAHTFVYKTPTHTLVVEAGRSDAPVSSNDYRAAMFYAHGGKPIVFVCINVLERFCTDGVTPYGTPLPDRLAVLEEQVRACVTGPPPRHKLTVHRLCHPLQSWQREWTSDERVYSTCVDPEDPEFVECPLGAARDWPGYMWSPECVNALREFARELA